MKTRFIRMGLALVVLIAVVAVAYAASLYVQRPTPVVWGAKGKGLGQDQIITGSAGARGYGVYKGDAFPFLLEVMYDSDQIAGIDRASLDKSVNFKPFEIRSFQETESSMDARTRIYRRQYELQLIEGKVDQTYELPTIVVRYQLKNKDGFAEKAVVPTPILVAGRLPEDVGDTELRPITDLILDPSRDRLIAVLWIVGGLVAVGSLADLTWRVVPRWRMERQKRQKLAGSEVLIQAYRSLNAQVAAQAEPKRVFHQIDHLLRLVLAEKQGMNWLEEPNLDKVSGEIQPVITALYQKCQWSYGLNGTGLELVDVQAAMHQLDAILQFYFGLGQVEQWRSS